MHSRIYKSLELFLLFILLPISFTLSFPIAIKIGIAVCCFVYVLYFLKKAGHLKMKLPKREAWKPFWKSIAIQCFSIVIITILYVNWIAPKALFYVVLNNTSLWVFILIVYAFLSVFPQELIYRTFFFERYRSLFSNQWLFIFINAIVFSIAHIFFQNVLVQVLTFIGGLLFAYTYYKTKSTLLVSIEHAVYGNWLFTVGMGEMLAFPGMQ